MAVKRVPSAQRPRRERSPRQCQDSVDRMLREWQRERPELDSSPFRIQGRILRLSALLMRKIDGWLGPLGLSWEAFSLIVTLRRSGKPYALRPTDLLRESLLTSGAITNRIDRVERLGLVERRPDPQDGRSWLIKLTPAGKKLADIAIARHFSSVGREINVLTGSEQDQLAELLSKLLASFEGEVEKWSPYRTVVSASSQDE